MYTYVRTYTLYIAHIRTYTLYAHVYIGSNTTDGVRMTRFKSSPSFDYLDEAHEANWSPESIVNNPHELFQPVSLCLVSRLPLFDLLQVSTS